MEKKIASWTHSQIMKNNSYEINYYIDYGFHTVDMHSHDFFELYFFMKGDVTYGIEHGRYTLKPNDMLLIPPNNLHMLSTNNPSDCYERIILWINPKILIDYSTPKTDFYKNLMRPQTTQAYLINDNKLSSNIKAKLIELNNQSQNEEYGSDIMREIALKDILLQLAKYFEQDKEEEPLCNTLPDFKNQEIASIMEYINKNLNNDLSIENISKALFFSKCYISKIFRLETKFTIHRYIKLKRLLYAKQLIEQNLPIVEVYLMCGFKDYSNFFRAFKNEFGLTPKDYFNALKNKSY